jgi:hypothetical protein
MPIIYFTIIDFQSQLRSRDKEVTNFKVYELPPGA